MKLSVPHWSSAIFTFTLLAATLAGESICRADARGQVLGMRFRTAFRHGQDQVGFSFRPQKKIKKVVFIISREGGGKIRFVQRRIGRGEVRRLTWRQGLGTFEYQGEARIKYYSGKKERLRFAFQVAVVEPLSVRMTRQDVDGKRHKLRFWVNRAPVQVEFTVKGDGGQLIDNQTIKKPKYIHGKPITLHWADTGGPGETVEQIIIKVSDKYGFGYQMRAIPFTIYIPHDEVQFKSGSAHIRKTEIAKLRATLRKIRTALRKHAGQFQIQLYIAGYTDTVGSHRYNLNLSHRRARSIAAFFMRQRLRIPIHYQGFGESVLAVGTPDETPNNKNRRALYILSAGQPDVCPTLPRADWRRLR